MIALWVWITDGIDYDDEEADDFGDTENDCHYNVPRLRSINNDAVMV